MLKACWTCRSSLSADWRPLSRSDINAQLWFVEFWQRSTGKTEEPSLKLLIFAFDVSEDKTKKNCLELDIQKSSWNAALTLHVVEQSSRLSNPRALLLKFPEVNLKKADWLSLWAIVRPGIVCFALFVAWQSTRTWYFNCTASMIAHGVVVRVIMTVVDICLSNYLWDPGVLRFESRSPIQVFWGSVVPIITLCLLLDQNAGTKMGSLSPSDV